MPDEILGMIPHPTFRAAALCIVTLAACKAEQPKPRPGQVDGSPAVSSVAKIPLTESDSAPLGTFLYPSKGPDGTFYVSDMANSRVVVFAPDGKLARTIGRKGGGPGEFQGPAANGLIDGGRALAVSDVSTLLVSLFRADSGSFIRSVRLPGNNVGFNWTVQGDTVLFALAAPSLFARWITTTDSVVALGQAPQRLIDDMGTALSHGRADIARSNRGIVALLPTEPGLHLLDPQGTKTGFVNIPSRRRRGEPVDLFERARAERAKGLAGFAPVGSVVVGLRLLSNGELVTVMMDVDQVGVPKEGQSFSSVRIFGNYRVWATLVRADLSAACVDAPIPVNSDVLPLPFFSGDTLWVLSSVEDDAGSVKRSAEGFLLSDEGCEWIPTGGVGAPRS